MKSLSALSPGWALIWLDRAREEWAWPYISELEASLGQSCRTSTGRKIVHDSSLDVSVMDRLVAVVWFPPRPGVSDVIHFFCDLDGTN